MEENEEMKKIGQLDNILEEELGVIEAYLEKKRKGAKKPRCLSQIFGIQLRKNLRMSTWKFVILLHQNKNNLRSLVDDSIFSAAKEATSVLS